MGKLFSGNAGKKEMKEANRLMRDNVAKLEAIDIPTVEAQKIALQYPELIDPIMAGQIDPAQILKEERVDPRLERAQYSALENLAQVGETGGDPQAELDYFQALRQAGAREQAGAQSALQRAGEMGSLDSGSLLAAQLQGAQSSGDAALQAGMQRAASGQQARMAALGQMANQAASMGEAQRGSQARAQQNMLNIEQFNKQLAQQAEMANKGYLQQRAGQIAGIQGQQEMYNKGLIQQQLQNQFQKTGAVTGQQSNLAGNLQQQAAAAQAAKQAQTGALVGLAGTLGGAALGGPMGAAIGSKIAGTATDTSKS